MRDELTEYEWTAIKPMLPNKPHGVPRVNDWCVRAYESATQMSMGCRRHGHSRI
jgi:transposase